MTEKTRNSCRILVGELTKNRSTERYRKLNNITMNHTEINCENVCRAELSQVRFQWQSFGISGVLFPDRKRERETVPLT